MIVVYHGVPNVRMQEIVEKRDVALSTHKYSKRHLVCPSQHHGDYIRVHVAENLIKARNAAYFDALCELVGAAEYTDTVYVLEMVVDEDIVLEDDQGKTWVAACNALPVSCIRNAFTAKATPGDIYTAAAFIHNAEDEDDLKNIREETFTNDFFGLSRVTGSCLDAAMENLFDNLDLIPVSGQAIQMMLSAGGRLEPWGAQLANHAELVMDLMDGISAKEYPDCSWNSAGEFTVDAIIYGTGIQCKLQLQRWLDNADPFKIAKLLLNGPYSRYTNEVACEIGKYDARAAGMCMTETVLMELQNLDDESDDMKFCVRFGFDVADLEDFLQNEYNGKWEKVSEAKERLIEEKRKAIQKRTEERAEE